MRAWPVPETGPQAGDSRSWRIAPPAVLELLTKPSVNIVCWQRSIPGDPEDPLVAWAARARATFHAVVSAGSYNLSLAVDGIEEPVRSWLMTDIAVLLARFSCLVAASRFRFSFGAVHDNQCRKFHVDHHRFRLVTTYAGPGTEWVPNEAVRWEALNHPADCPCDANLEIVRDAAAVRRATAGDVLIMKGVGHAVPGAVHRSPPIEGTRRSRVVLIASTVTEA